MKRFVFAVLMVMNLLTCLPAYSQFPKAKKQETIDSISSLLRFNYVFEEVADKLAKTLQRNELLGYYDTISSGKEFAFQLTRDIQSLSKDLHLKVEYAPRATRAADEKNQQPVNTGDDWLTVLLKENNYGITEKKILPGNTGYLNISLFGPLEKCADSIMTALATIQHTDALIIDLRNCRGSLDENTIPFVCSYFFRDPVQLSAFYERKTHFTKQFWTTARVCGEKYLDKPVYIITSGRTFSGGEAFAYDMQQLKRARVIGEVTRGGAHPTEQYSTGTSFNIAIPYARTINPVSKTNWEQVGVQPDSLVKSNRALYCTRLIALEKLLAIEKDKNKQAVFTNAFNELLANAPKFRKLVFSLEGFENAKEVAVAGSFNSYARKNFLLQRQNNKWIGETEVEPGELSYMFIVDGKWINDPANQKTIKVNGALNSLLVVE